METMLFPMKTLRVTQGYGVAYGGVPANTYSHKGGYALDLGGEDGGADWLYAPCDLVVRRIYGNYNAVWFESLEPVAGVGGTVIMLCLHMNNADREALGMRVGKVFRRGEKCYREGMSGKVTGTHVHLELGRGPMTGTGWAVNGQGVWVINRPLVPSEVFTLGTDVKVVNTGGYAWRRETAKPEEAAVQPLADTPVYMVTNKPVSRGDQILLITLAHELGIGFKAPEATQADELRQALADAEAKAENEAARADRAVEQSAQWLKMIEAAKVALGV